MKYILILLTLVISHVTLFSEEITLDIEITTEFEDYRYYLMYLGSNPDTLFVEQKSEYPKRITFKTDYKLPFATALFIQTTDKMAMSTNLIEVDTNYMTIKIDRVNEKYSFIGTDFQTYFNSIMNEMLKLEEDQRNGKIAEEELNKYYSETTIKMIEEYPEHPIGYLLVTKILNELSDSDLRLLKSLINYKGADNPQIEDINKVITTMIPLRESYSVESEINEISNLILPNKTETSVNLTKGKHLIYVWSTRCGPCISTLRNVNSNLDSFDSDVNLVTISVDYDVSRWYKFVEIEKFNFPTYLSNNNSILEIFNVSSLPFTILIEDGKVSKLNPTVKDYIH